LTLVLSRIDIQKIEEFWLNHKENKKQLKFREWELLNPSQEQDENIGGSSSGFISNPTERNAIRLLEDKLYQNLKVIIRTIENLYNELDEDTQMIVDMRYWDKENNCYEWEEIADKLFISRSKVLRKRNHLIDETAKLIGWV
jgi:RinA family phage transcriptional activator